MYITTVIGVSILVSVAAKRMVDILESVACQDGVYTVINGIGGFVQMVTQYLPLLFLVQM